jgi:YrbI family 3-deoxy-D-manno-octulosonate 8-phosphate phosphatase
MSEPAGLSGPSEVARGTRLVVFDFDGVFTDNAVWCDDEGNEWVRCWRGDGIGIARLLALGVPIWVLSTETHAVVARRCEKLGLPVRQGLSDKAAALEELVATAGVSWSQTAYVGNDVNDEACLALVGLSIVVADAHPAVAARARYVTSAPGGYGAVREVCDWISDNLDRGGSEGS